MVTKASFSQTTNSPDLVVDYNVGSEKLQYKTDQWFLTSYKPGRRVTIIYDPANPSVASIYSFIGYWIKWKELFYTAIFFIILFIAAKSIAGQSNNGDFQPDERLPKRKYDG